MKKVAFRFISKTSFAIALWAGMTLSGFAGEESVIHIKYEDNGSGVRTLISKSVVAVDEAPTFSGDRHEISYPQFIAEHEQLGQATIVEAWLKNADIANEMITQRSIVEQPENEFDAADELFTIVESGPSANRIDLVFMGDGYTQNERQKFISDIQRMVNDMFVSDTFASYLPVFNVYAVFRASNESGIGRNDRAKDTAYGLYREGNTLRAIYPSNTSALRASCRVAPGCDYPVVIANDPYYGGLGGEFAISTSSETSGTVVLRHELGHNFGRVGEEYDGGGYFGANNSSSLSSLKWSHWSTLATTRAEPSKARFLAWPWHNLTSGPYKATFTCDADYPYASVRFSASGLGADGSLKLELDNQEIPYNSPGTEDRSFHNYDFPGFGSGRHELKFTELEHDGDNWVSSITVHEYATDYHFDDTFIGAYPVFSQGGGVAGYRPTHETCLMRNMQSTSFCSVCQENNWIEFFQKVKMIDDVSVESTGSGVTVKLDTLNLGQFQKTAKGTGHVDIRWSRNGQPVDSLNDLDVWTLPTRDAQGTWAVEVTYKTPEVRKDSSNRLRDRRTVQVN